MATGKVAFWHREEGWGGVEAPDEPGIGFAHFSHVRTEGFRYLVQGENVEYERGPGGGQDGCQWRVEWVRPLDRS